MAEIYNWLFILNYQAMSYAKLAGLQPIYGLCKFSPCRVLSNYNSVDYIYELVLREDNHGFLITFMTVFEGKLSCRLFLFLLMVKLQLSYWNFLLWPNDPPNWNGDKKFDANPFKLLWNNVKSLNTTLTVLDLFLTTTIR